MTQMSHSPRLIESFVKAALIAALAAVLLLPATVRTSGAEAGPHAAGFKASIPAPREGLRLPPIPQLDTMPWLVREPADRGFRVDMLLSPRLERTGRAQAAGASHPSWAVQRPTTGPAGPAAPLRVSGSARQQG